MPRWVDRARCFAPAPKPLGLLNAAFLALGFTGALASGIPHDEDVRKHFEWGEYDSLAMQVEPLVNSDTAPADPALLARYRIYLGVAYFAAGRLGDAREQFRKALAAVPDAALERKYVSNDLYDLFDATRREVVEEMEQKRRTDSLGTLAAARAQHLAAGAALRASRRVSTALGITGVASAAILAAVVYDQYSAGRRDEDEFRTAAAEGDAARYDEYGRRLNMRNTTISLCGVAGLLCAAGGTAFFVRVGGRTKQLRRLSVSVAPQYRLLYVMDF